jgi:hypothetical protein
MFEPFKEAESSGRRSLISNATFSQQNKTIKHGEGFRRRLVDGANNRFTPLS